MLPHFCYRLLAVLTTMSSVLIFALCHLFSPVSYFVEYSQEVAPNHSSPTGLGKSLRFRMPLYKSCDTVCSFASSQYQSYQQRTILCILESNLSTMIFSYSVGCQRRPLMAPTVFLMCHWKDHLIYGCCQDGISQLLSWVAGVKAQDISHVLPFGDFNYHTYTLI